MWCIGWKITHVLALFAVGILKCINIFKFSHRCLCGDVFVFFFYPILGSYWKSTLSSEVSILSLSYIFKLLSIVYAQALSFMWSCGDIKSHSKFYFLCLTCISVELKSCFAWHFPRIIFHQILFTSIAQPKSCWKMLQFHTYL